MDVLGIIFQFLRAAVLRKKVRLTEIMKNANLIYLLCISKKLSCNNEIKSCRGSNDEDVPECTWHTHTHTV